MSNPKSDDRRDNESKIKRTIDATRAQMEAADEMIENTDNPQMKADLEAKNERRTQAIEDMEVEATQEAEYNKNHD